MSTPFAHSIRYLVLVLASFLLLSMAPTAGAGEQKLIATDLNHVAIQGYDTVAYFADGKAVKGSSQFEYVWGDAKWQFASAAHRDLFAADPERYAPQYGGFCANAMENGELSIANPTTWTIVDGKLYMFAGKKLIGGWYAADTALADQRWRSRTGQ
jgi:hypothetical protein